MSCSTLASKPASSQVSGFAGFHSRTRASASALRPSLCNWPAAFSAAFYETARCEGSLGRWPEAQESLGGAVARAPKNRAYLDFFAAILHQLGRNEEALTVRRKSEALAADERKRSQ